MLRSLARSSILASSLAFATACGTNTDTKTTDGGPLWEQTFAKWTCHAAGRADFSFEVVRKSQFGSDHEWTETGKAALPATVDLTNLYLMSAPSTPFRNFEYVANPPGTLVELDEWTLTAGNETPYRCKK
jgi:hypothetical protein